MDKRKMAALLKAYHSAKIAADKVKTIGNQIKAEMNKAMVDRVETDDHIASITHVTTKRFDTAAFQRDHPNMYDQYLVKQETVRLNFK